MITTIDRTHAAAVGHFELRVPRMGQSSRMAISQGESCRPPSPSDTTTSSRFVSAVEEQIERSRAHWSTLAEHSSSGLGEEGEGDCEAEESNKQEFMDLQRHPTWGTFFNTFGQGELVVGEKFAEGGQAELFHAKVLWSPQENNEREGREFVVKVFKKGTSLRDLRSQWPNFHVEDMENLKSSTSKVTPRYFCKVYRGILLENGQFAFLMLKDGMDLRSLIERNMESRSGDCGPFSKKDREVMKPLNVLGKRVHDPERFYTVKLVDFGISKAKVSKYSHSTLNSGTSRWMAPELIKMADADHKSPICGLPKLKNEAPNHSLFKTPDQGTRGWSVNEIRTMLELTEEALKVDRGPDIWDYVSENLWEHYKFDRASTSCENMWGILLQSYKETQASTEFELEYRNIIERILTRKLSEDNRNDAGFSLSAPASPLCPFQSSASDMVQFVSTCCDEMLYDEATDEEMEEVDTHSQDEEFSGDSTATFESQVETHFSRINEPDYETNSNNAGRKMSADIIMKDELISRIAPFVNKQIEDALKPLLSVLRKREEDEQMHREKLLTIKEEKLALKREKISFARRVLANF
ncbi:hypothetical protein M758_9G069100 [Ceratodon purpureus]|nr:hypothetical protein M758_9G069100 [Ceratodon purpureus]